MCLQGCFKRYLERLRCCSHTDELNSAGSMRASQKYFANFTETFPSNIICNINIQGILAHHRTCCCGNPLVQKYVRSGSVFDERATKETPFCEAADKLDDLEIMKGRLGKTSPFHFPHFHRDEKQENEEDRGDIAPVSLDAALPHIYFRQSAFIDFLPSFAFCLLMDSFPPAVQ